MIEKDNSIKNSGILLVTLTFVYVCLFEFILPVNKLLPRPSLLIESFVYIWKDYNLLHAFTVTATVIYLMMILGFLTLYAFRGWLIKLFVEYGNLFLSFQFLRYLPAFVIFVLGNYYFNNKLIGEFIFAFLYVLYLLSNKLYNESKNVNAEYLVVAKNLKLRSDEMYKSVYWKSSLPRVFDSMKNIHMNLWLLVLTYEFIGNYDGIGSIYRTVAGFGDFTALFTIAIVISLITWFGNYLIITLLKKLIHWKP